MNKSKYKQVKEALAQNKLKILKFLWESHNNRPGYAPDFHDYKYKIGLAPRELWGGLMCLHNEYIIQFTDPSLKDVSHFEKTVIFVPAQGLARLTTTGMKLCESRFKQKPPVKNENPSVDSKSLATKNHEGDEKMAVDKSIGHKEVQFRHNIRTEILKYLYKLHHERSDFIPSVINIFKATGLASSQLQEIQLAISYLNDEKLIEHLDGSVEEYGKHLNPQRPLGKITSKGIKEVEEMLSREKTPINKGIEKNLNKKKVLEFYFHHNRKQNKQAQAAISVGELPDQKEEFPYIDDIEKDTGLTRDTLAVYMVNLHGDGFLDLFGNPGYLTLPSAYRRSSSKQGFPSAITKAGILQVKLWQDEPSLSAKEKKKRTSQIKSECQRVLNNRDEKKEKLEIDPLPEKVGKKPDVEQSVDEYIFRHVTGGWNIVFEGKPYVRIGSCKGLEYIQMLLKAPQPEVGIPSLVMVRALNGNPLPSEYAEQEARQGGLNIHEADCSGSYKSFLSERDRKYLQQLEDKLDDAKSLHNEEEVAQLKNEIHDLMKSRKTELAPEIKTAGSSVSRAIERARKEMEQPYPELYSHLKSFLHPGKICVYSPPKRVPWKF